MASFATLAAAESRVRTKIADGTWITGHAALGTLDNAGAPQFVVRVIRKMSPAAPDNGGWVELNDDSLT
jgi:hypothetical protein